MKSENKILVSLLTLIVLITVVCSYFAFQKENKVENKTDAVKIKEEYANLNNQINEDTKQTYPFVELEDNNPFVYETEEEIIKILEAKSGIIYFGFANCPWCRSILPILSDSAKEEAIEEIYYLDIKNMRDILELDENDKIITTKEGNANYYKILELLNDVLSDYILTSKEGTDIKTGEKRLYAPTVVVVKNGEIQAIHEGSLDTQENGYEELSEKQQKELKKIYSSMMKNLKENNCKEGC